MFINHLGDLLNPISDFEMWVYLCLPSNNPLCLFGLDNISTMAKFSKCHCMQMTLLNTFLILSVVLHNLGKMCNIIDFLQTQISWRKHHCVYKIVEPNIFLITYCSTFLLIHFTFTHPCTWHLENIGREGWSDYYCGCKKVF